MLAMLIFLILGLLKISFVIVLIALVSYIIIMRKLNRRNEKRKSLGVLRSLSKVKFSSLVN